MSQALIEILWMSPCRAPLRVPYRVDNSVDNWGLLDLDEVAGLEA
jgi:hypothetical protein